MRIATQGVSVATQTASSDLAVCSLPNNGGREARDAQCCACGLSDAVLFCARCFTRAAFATMAPRLAGVSVVEGEHPIVLKLAWLRVISYSD